MRILTLYHNNNIKSMHEIFRIGMTIPDHDKYNKWQQKSTKKLAATMQKQLTLNAQ